MTVTTIIILLGFKKKEECFKSFARINVKK